MKAKHVSHTGLHLYECTDNSFFIAPDQKQRQHIKVAILPELRGLIPPLADAERRALRDSILTIFGVNLRDSLTVGFLESTGQYVFLDGHNRYSILMKEWPDNAERAGVPIELVEGDDVPYRIVDLPDIAAAKLWILENQVSRRNLNDDQRAVIWNEIREQRSAKQRAEQLASARDGAVSVKTSDTEKVDTRKAVAKEAKLPERKLRAAQELKKASPKLAAKVMAGELTLKEAKQAAATHNAKPKKELDTDGRYRKLHSAVLSIYSHLPVKERQEEIRQHATQLVEDCC